MTDRTIATVPKNASEEVHVSLREFKGHRLIDLRVFTKSAVGGEPLPTRKGVTLKIGTLPELIGALQKAEVEARAAGLLSDAPEGERE